jgi:copper(I)-binding protein
MAARLFIAALVLVCCAACGPAPAPGPADQDGDTDPALRVTDARIRMPVPGQDKTAAYFTVENRQASVFVLTGAESGRARAIEIHTIEREGDMVRMRRQQQIVVAPGETIAFQPGGLHLMIFGLNAPDELNAPGSDFEIILLGADGERITRPFRVIALGAD